MELQPRIQFDLPNREGLVLYLDIGGSAVKSSILPCQSTSDFCAYLAKNQNAEIDRTEWNPSESGETVTEMAHRLVSNSKKIHRVAISIGGSEVSSNGREYKGWMKRKGRVEKNLAGALEKKLDLKRGSVSIRNDSYAWGQGVRSWLHHSGKSLADGIGLLVIGTGVAFTVLTDTGVEIRHIHDWNRYDWSDLARFANFKHGDWIHKHLGAGYFKWRDKEDRKKLDRLDDNIAALNALGEDTGKSIYGCECMKGEIKRGYEITQRYQLVLDQLSRAHNLSRFLIGGGCAPRLEGRPFTQQVGILTSENIGFDPGFLPFLGLSS